MGSQLPDIQRGSNELDIESDLLASLFHGCINSGSIASSYNLHEAE